MTECIDASIIVKWFHKGEAFDAESHMQKESLKELFRNHLIEVRSLKGI